jgi:predicted transposase/invertase (TIGR01784 family)
LREGELQGRAEGEVKTRLAVARNLLRKGLSIADVAESAELSLEEVQELKNTWKN